MAEIIKQSGAFVRSYKDLEVYRLAYKAALDVHEITKDFPKDELYGMVSQMRRASKSICANLAEGFAKQADSSPEFKRFLSIAIGSANEMDVWASFAYDLKYIDEAASADIAARYLSIAKMLNRLRNG